MTRGKILSVALIAAFAALSSPAFGQANSTATAPAPAKKPAAAPAAAAHAEKQDLAAGDLRAIHRPPLPEFHPQQPKRIQLENGMVIFLQEDHELPLIEATMTIRGGAKNELADKIGLVNIYGGAWRTGGTKTKTGDELDDLLEARAARIETSHTVGTLQATFLTLSSLKGDFDFVLDLANDLLRNPEFRQDKIDLAKDQVRTGISRRNDNIGQIAGREATKVGYGAKSPYARVPEYDTVAAVTRQDLLDWHAKYVHPNNIILAVAGDFDSAAMEDRLRKLFADWPKGPATTAADVEVTPPQSGVYFAAKDDVNQSEIRMVAAGIRRDDADYYAVQVMNEILSGGFASRLFSNLRTKAGLAYAVGGGVGSAFDHPGLTTLSIGTKSGTTAKAVDGLYKQIEGMTTHPATAEELERAKDSILNSFIFEYDSKEKVMNARANYEFQGYPADFLERYQKGVAKVTANEVNRVARKYLQKDKFALLVVGKSADFDKPLSTFGAVTTLDITIPQPGAASAVASATPVATNPEGKALLAKVIEAAGGAAKLNALKAVRRKSTLTLKAQGMQIESEQLEVGEDKVHIKLNTPGGEMIMVASDQGGFMSMAAVGTRDMPGSQRATTMKNLRFELWSIAQHADDPKYTFAAQGKERIGDVEATVLDISNSKDQMRWFVDPKTGRVLRSQFQGETPNGPATQVVDFSQWKTIDGVTLPFHSEISSNGTPSASVAVSSVEFNPAVDAKLFDRPQN